MTVGPCATAHGSSFNTLCDHARMSIRPAATIVVARPAALGRSARDADGIEVLLLRRSTRSRFAPGFVVFPGGVVEAGDREAARRWFGSEAQVARACALRELAEETGLVMTDRGLVSSPGSMPGEDTFAVPRSDAVPEIARWIAPDFLPVRFDAVFFAVSAPRGLDPTPDGIEVDRASWLWPGEALEAHVRGNAPLMWPTLKTLEALVECRSVADVLRLRVEQVAPPRPGA